MDGWPKTFPAPEESPAHLVKDLRLEMGVGCHETPEEIFEYIPWFTNVERMTVSYWIPFFPRELSSLRLPQSVTSFTIDGNATLRLLDIRDTIAQLPNLNDLSLSGSLAARDGEVFPGVGTALRGRFSGRLRLLARLAHEDVINMLLEIPTGLHLVEVQIHARDGCFLSVVRLAEACRNTLVKLSYTISYAIYSDRAKSHPSSRSN